MKDTRFMKTGFVLEGGAMRGMFTAGVLDTLMKYEIPTDGIVGVSAGALFGVNYLSNQPGRVIRYNKRFNKEKDYLGFRPLLREGNIVSTRYAYEKVPRELDIFDDAVYKSAKAPFYAVATDIKTGEPDYIRVKSVFDQMDVLRASGSMPFVSKPVKIGNKEYLDGGISDSIPFEWMSGQGYDKLIVVLTRDKSYRKKAMSKALIKLFYRNLPLFAKRLLERHEEYNQTVEMLNQWEEQGKAFVIRPSEPIKIRKIEKDPEKLQEIYELGVKDCEAVIGKLREYLGK